MSQESRQSPLFKQYPLSGTAATSAGQVQTPYHIYAGSGVFMGGTASLDKIRALLAPEEVIPVRTSRGEAVVGLWVCDFADASLGPHHELQFSIFVTRQTPCLLPSHPLSALVAMLSRPEVLMMCHGLWNNTPLVTAYNRELLGLTAGLADSKIEHSEGEFSFHFVDHFTRAPLATGRLSNPVRSSFQTNTDLINQIGVRQTLNIARQPWTRLQMVNPVSPSFPKNLTAEAFTKIDTNVVHYFDAQDDRVEISAAPYRTLEFKPQFVQFMEGIKFVYLNPVS